MLEITLSELTYLNDASKALKQRSFVYMDGVIIGLDNLTQYLIYIELDPNKFNIAKFQPFVMQSKELSDFIKAITTESSFDFLNNIIATSNGTMLTFYNDQMAISLAYDRMSLANKLNHITAPTYDINDIADEIRSMKVSDGCIRKVVGGYYITIFPGMFPLLKSDTVTLTVCSVRSTVVTMRYNVTKTKFRLVCYVAYLLV